MSRSHNDDDEIYSSELLPCSSQFFPAGAELPFGSPPSHEVQQADAGRASDSQDPGYSATVQQYITADSWQLPVNAAVQQRGGGLFQQLHVPTQLLQATAVPEYLTAGGSDGLHSSINTHTQKLLSLPTDSQQTGVAGFSIGRYSSGRPVELSPVPERSGTSPALFHELGNTAYGQSKATQQLSVLQLPCVTCQAAGDSRLKSQSVPSSPIHGSRTFVSRSLSLQKSLERGASQQQVHRLSQEYQKLSYARDGPVPGAAAATPALKASVTTGDTAASNLGSQQELLTEEAAGSSRRSSRGLGGQLTRQTSSVRVSVGKEAEWLLQAEMAHLRDDNCQLQDRLLSVQQQLSKNQELLAERQEQLLAAQAELVAAAKQKSTLEEQLQHLEAKVHATESQLEFAHKQLDIRQQELRSQADAAKAAKRSGEQLVTEVEALKEELLASRRELEAVNKRLALEAAEARRAADESSCLRRDLTALQSELGKSQQETADTRERMRQAAAEADKKSVQMEGQLADTTQQVMMLKERMTAMQSANDRLHGQLASAESDNSILRSDMADLLTERQELLDSREKLRQMQLESNRRFGQLEGDLADASQQLTFVKSQNERLNDQLIASNGGNAVLRADLDNTRAALNSANRALQEAHMQHDDLMRQARQKVHQQQLQIQRLQQQLDQAAAVSPAVQPAVSGFGIGSSYAGPGGATYRANMGFGDDDNAVSARIGGWGTPSKGDAYDFMSMDPGRTQQQQPGYNSSFDRTAATGITSSNSPDRWTPALGPSDNLGREISAYYAAAPTQYSPGSRQLPSGDVSPSRGPDRGWLEQGPGVAAEKSSRLAAAPVSYPSGVNDVGPRSQTPKQQAMPVSTNRADDIPWFAGGSRNSPGGSGRPAAAQQPVQQHVPAKGAAGAGYLTAERSEHWQPSTQASYQVQQQQQMMMSAGPGSVNSSSPVRAATTTLTEQRQHQQAAAGAAVLTPFGTEMTVAEIMARTKELEDHLLAYCQEKDDLNKEYSRMPVGAGRTLKERQRKQFVEQRLEELDAAISKTRMQLKRMSGR